MGTLHALEFSALLPPVCHMTCQPFLVQAGLSKVSLLTSELLGILGKSCDTAWGTVANVSGPEEWRLLPTPSRVHQATSGGPIYLGSYLFPGALSPTWAASFLGGRVGGAAPPHSPALDSGPEFSSLSSPLSYTSLFCCCNVWERGQLWI